MLACLQREALRNTQVAMEILAGEKREKELPKWAIQEMFTGDNWE